MFKRPLPEPSFWSSKLGIAACVSIAATLTMILVTANIEVDLVQTAPLALPLADTIVIAGLA